MEEPLADLNGLGNLFELDQCIDFVLKDFQFLKISSEILL
jgi:hypothetical protein